MLFVVWGDASCHLFDTLLDLQVGSLVRLVCLGAAGHVACRLVEPEIGRVLKSR
jgi:hypothetical protein